MSASENWSITMIELPGVIEGGMPGRNGQRKPGTTRGSPRRSRTAKASRISRPAVKSRCACEWGGWGRLSDDRPDSTTRTRARTLGRRTTHPPLAVHWHVTDPTLSGIFVDTNAMHEGRRQTNTGPAHAGSRLKLTHALGRRRPKCHPSSRTGENPPYGMIGGIEETSASFEARSAPRSYPTAGVSSNGHPYRDPRAEGDRQIARVSRHDVQVVGNTAIVRHL